MLTLDRRYESGAPSITAARGLLADPSPPDATLAALGSAALCAICALALAAAVILGAAMPDHGGASAPTARPRADLTSGPWSR